MQFKNKVVIVTGASSGIGAAAARDFTKLGADVVIVARNQTKLDKVSADCQKIGKKPLVVNADITKDADVKKIIECTINNFEKIDVLVNNAGAGSSVSFEDKGAMKAFDDIMALNLRAVVHLTHLAIPYLLKTKGNVVNISSIAALKPNLNFWAYCTSKAALDHFTRCIAAELGPKGVRVNSVNPGPVKTDFLENMGIQDGNSFMEKAAQQSILNRVSESEEISDVILFLASDKARGVTGSSWVTDDGFMLK